MRWYLPDGNPLFWDEFRRRRRGGRGFAIMLGYAAMMVALVIGTAATTPVGGAQETWPEFGKSLWLALMVGQAALLVIIGPGLTASAITGERERGTLDFLFTTPLSSRQLIHGKYLSAYSHLLLMVLSGLPVVATVFIFGGVSLLEFLGAYVLLLCAGGTSVALGLLASCLCMKTVYAVGLAYGLMMTAVLMMGCCLAVPIMLYLLGLPAMLMTISLVLGHCTEQVEMARSPQTWQMSL